MAKMLSQGYIHSLWGFL